MGKKKRAILSVTLILVVKLCEARKVRGVCVYGLILLIAATVFFIKLVEASKAFFFLSFILKLI